MCLIRADTDSSSSAPRVSRVFHLGFSWLPRVLFVFPTWVFVSPTCAFHGFHLRYSCFPSCGLRVPHLRCSFFPTCGFRVSLLRSSCSPLAFFVSSHLWFSWLPLAASVFRTCCVRVSHLRFSCVTLTVFVFPVCGFRASHLCLSSFPRVFSFFPLVMFVFSICDVLLRFGTHSWNGIRFQADFFCLRRTRHTSRLRWTHILLSTQVASF